jgi:tetratricopeptide (TPR) repeat protein
MTTHLERLRARFDELDGLPFGPERIAGHLALEAEAAAAGDPSFQCKVLIWLSDDFMETGDRPRMIEYFDKAWERFLEHEEAIDPHVRFNLRTTFGPTVNALASDPDLPERDLRIRFNVMEAFYRKYDYSLRALHRVRFWYHRRRGENELATEQVELLIAEPGDYGARCDANGPMIGAQWYQGAGADVERAAELWRSVLELADQRCAEDHRAEAYSELMHLASKRGRYAEARRCHRAGYRLIRRAPNEWRALDMHMIFAQRARDVAGFLRIVHDHTETLDAPLDEDVFWYQGRVVQFLHLLAERGHGALPITLADRSETTADELLARLTANLTAYVEAAPDEQAREERAARLTAFREQVLDKIDLPAEEETDSFWDTVLPPVPSPWAAPPDLADLPKGWSAQDALLAEARVLDFVDHPHSDGAWARVAALGTPRSPADQARLAEYRSNVLVREGDYASGRIMRTHAAELLEQDGRTNRALYNRILAALCAYLTHDQETALAERDAVVARAGAEHAAGRMPDGELLSILVEDFRLDSIIEIMAFGADPNALMDNAASNAKFTAANNLYLAKQVAHGPWALLLDAWAFYRQQMSRLYARYGLAHEFVRSATHKVDFWYARARDGYRDALMFTQQSEREGSRGENLLDAELYEDAELAAVEALRLNAGLDPKNRGKLLLLQAQAIRGQLGADTDRDDEVLVAAREAAALLSEDDDEGAAAARALIADMHTRAERYDAALEVYESVLRSLDEEAWGKRAPRRALRRATAGKIVCLRRTERADEAQDLIEDLYTRLPEWNRVTVAWIRHDVGRAFQFFGDEQQAFEDYSEAIHLADAHGKYEPHFVALLHAAEALARSTPKSAMTMLDEAVSVIGKAIEDERAVLAEREERTAERARARGEAAPEHTDPAEPAPAADPVMLARQAHARTLRVELLLDENPAPKAVLDELLPEAYRAAAQGAETLAHLVHATPADDPRRRSFMTDLETATGWLVAVQRGSGDLPGATARLNALAELAESCGFPQLAARAAEKARGLGAGSAGSIESGSQGAESGSASASSSLPGQSAAIATPDLQSPVAAEA